MSVTIRFEKFLNNLSLSQVQKDDGQTKKESVIKKLNREYYASDSNTDNSIYVGSWGKGTRIAPPRDVDVLFKLPIEVYKRFEIRTGNKQSQLLQEIKEKLKPSFPRTDIRGDGPVVVIPFDSFMVELLPAILLTSGKYWICETNDGGRYKNIDPDAEVRHVSESNTKTNNNTRDLIRMAKCWQGFCNVPIKSFYLEILSVDFLNQWTHAGQGKLYYDFMVRDFFKYIISQAGSYLKVPGTGELIKLPNNLGEAWKSRAESAYSRAEKACSYEAVNKLDMAGDEWQKIFGTWIPKNL